MRPGDEGEGKNGAGRGGGNRKRRRQWPCKQNSCSVNSWARSLSVSTPFLDLQ
ncbi:hypothetical protein RRG08_020279 [Elysia crispata]|uniref:Uncharacterized protein n=1 Tax=Elysia crispata TaxID=231223 RepID=A0AAE1B671_9GAST|nr:hypothetical protein RRG08_020279 [Elysia crispata]